MMQCDVFVSCSEFEKERLGKIKSLDECAVDDHLHDDEEQWKEMCDTRFGLSVSGQVYIGFPRTGSVTL